MNCSKWFPMAYRDPPEIDIVEHCKMCVANWDFDKKKKENKTISFQFNEGIAHIFFRNGDFGFVISESNYRKLDWGSGAIKWSDHPSNEDFYHETKRHLSNVLKLTLEMQEI